jgi:GNAT superfamily N-acetyltransferase
MKLIPLTSQHEPLFWQHVHQDIVQYFFYALDWIHERPKTQITLALHNTHLIGMMLTYNQQIIHLRGQPPAIEAFLQTIDLKEVELLAPQQDKHRVLHYFSPTTLNTTLMAMALNKEHVTPQSAYPVTQLHESDAPDIARVMREADPSFWGDMTEQRILQNMPYFQWIGIKHLHLSSVCSYRFSEWIGWVSIVATAPTRRNQGHASTILSYAVTDLFKKQHQALIHVRADNAPAFHVYQKVGFTPYKSYFLMRGRKTGN